MNYISITPCRNEEQNFEKSISALFYQSLRPTKAYIVDDGSSDKTPEIIFKLSKKFNITQIRIDPPRIKRKGFNFSYALRTGFKKGILDYPYIKYIFKMDADVLLQNRYYVETLVNKMEENSLLGILGGKSEFKTIELINHVEDAARLYRTKCLLQVLNSSAFLKGGWPIMFASDSFVLLRAQWLGWEINTVNNLIYKDLRPFKRNMSTCIELGRFKYKNGFSLLSQLNSILRSSKEVNSFVGSYVSFLSYLLGPLIDKREYEKEYYEYIRKWLDTKLIYKIHNLFNF